MDDCPLALWLLKHKRGRYYGPSRIPRMRWYAGQESAADMMRRELMLKPRERRERRDKNE